MKKSLHTYTLPTLSERDPSQKQDSGSRAGFYFLMSMLVIGLLYFLLMPFFV